MVLIKPTDKNLSLKDSVTGGKTVIRTEIAQKLEAGNYVFPSLGVDDTLGKKTLNYLSTEPILQGLTVPFKWRPRIPTATSIDSFPSQIETGVNVGLSLGLSLSYNRYNPDKSTEKNKGTTQISFTPGVFAGLGSVAISSSNTRNPQLGLMEVKRNVLSFTTGGVLMLGINNLHFGYAFGVDNIFGNGRNGYSWVYQGQLWHGLILGLDILK